jgi:hypothetical protein
MRTWLPLGFLLALSLGALTIGVINILVPFAEQAASVAPFAGKAYADEQFGAFARHPLPIRAHAGLGVLFVILAAFQYWRGFRNRHLKLHRILGYVGMGCLTLLPTTGVACAILYPFAGTPGVIPNLVWMTAILACVTASWRAVRRREIHQHEAWVTRASAMTVGITLSRLYQPLLVQVLHMEPHLALAVVFWLGQGEGLIAAEFWLRRPGGPLARRAPRPVLVT